MADTQNKYLAVDSRHMPLARVILDSPTQAALWQIRVLDGRVKAVLEHEVVQLVSMSEKEPSLLGRVLRFRGDQIALEPLRKLGEDVRQNLRMPVRFDSFIYPVTGAWTGRRKVVVHDMSCGGAAFFCPEALEEDEVVEVVIPVTAQPLVLKAKILRTRPSASDVELYATQFVDMIHDEESMVREAVFGIQIQNRDDREKENTSQEATRLL